MIHGKFITLKTAKTEERKIIYDMALKSGLVSYSFSYKTGLESFKKIYHEKYFNDQDPSVCGAMMIYLNNNLAGFISYSQAGDSKNFAAYDIRELDVWMNGEEYCGKGFGSDAVITLCEYLCHKYNIHSFYICSSKYNIRAISAFKKADFICLNDNEKTSFLLKFFSSKYLDTLDPYSKYLSAGNILLIKNIP